MKLYTRRQVVYAALTGGVAIVALAAALGFLRLPEKFLPGDFLSEPALEWEQPLIIGKPVQYTGPVVNDEENNIQIYERLNEAVVNITSVTFEYNWFLEPIPREGTGSGSIPSVISSLGA